MQATASGSTAIARFSSRHLAFVVPLVLIHAGCGLVFVVGSSTVSTTVFVITGAIQLFGITAGYHRLLSHHSFNTSRPFRFVLALFGTLAAQNGPLWWVGHHRHHHRHPDKEGDVHSPRAGLFWSHMGWLFSPRCIPTRRGLVGDLEQFVELRFLDRYGYSVMLGYAVLLYLIGETSHRLDPATGATGSQLVVWGSIISTVCIYHCVWSVNSLCHRYGRRRFPTGDDTRNNFIVSLLTLGDGWHHNHHYFPSSARHGFRWWEVDITYGILKLLACLGVVWDLKSPPPAVRTWSSSRDRGRGRP